MFYKQKLRRVKWTKKRSRFCLFFTILLFVTLFSTHYAIEKATQQKLFDDVNKLPKNSVGLVLGTAKKLKNGQTNLYFTYRIRAAVNLYNAGKVDYLLVSGDNGHSTYDEPTDFKTELIKQGIPEHKIYLDYAGFRTLDSVIRAKEVFGQTSITIISQKFHNQRAIYLAQKKGIQAVGYNAKDIAGRYGIKVKIREYFARTKVFFDLLFDVQPKFLGKKVHITKK